MISRPRRLDPAEIESLLALDAPARLATVDRQGLPHVTPLWFVWQDGSFFMTSIADRPHLKRLAADPRAGLVVDVENPERDDGERPNRQVRATGRADLYPDEGAAWTTRITRKYVRGPAVDATTAVRAADERTVIRLQPARLVAVASV